MKCGFNRIFKKFYVFRKNADPAVVGEHLHLKQALFDHGSIQQSALMDQIKSGEKAGNEEGHNSEHNKESNAEMFVNVFKKV